MLMHRSIRWLGVGLGAVALLLACNPDQLPTSTLKPSFGAPPPPPPPPPGTAKTSSPFILGYGGGTAVGGFGNPLNPTNGGRAAGPFWDNVSADDIGLYTCNIGFFAKGLVPNGCTWEAPGTTANQGGYTTYFGNGAAKLGSPAFIFSGAYTYSIKYLGSYSRFNSTVGLFTVDNHGNKVLYPMSNWTNKVVNNTISWTPPSGFAWGFYIQNNFNPDPGGCSNVTTEIHCSNSTGGYAGPSTFQQFALFSNSDQSQFLVGAEDNRLETSVGPFWAQGNFWDSDYNDYIWSVTPVVPCVINYPFVSSTARTDTAFNESTVLQAFDYRNVNGVNKLMLWATDEHAPLLGVATATMPVTPMPSNTSAGASAGPPLMWGDSTIHDLSDRPILPAIFLTDLTVNTANPEAGDWQYGGTPLPPDEIFGSWKAATFTGGKIVTATDPVKNTWNGIPDTPPNGFAAIQNLGYGTEVRWNTSTLNLVPGHKYRAQFMVHDGDQNNHGGDVGEACLYFTASN